MKKIIVTGILVLTLAFGIAMTAKAEFKPELQKDIGELLGKFFQDEMGNKVTEYSRDGLYIRLNDALRKNFIQPKPPEPKEIPKTEESKPPEPKEAK